MKQKIVAYHIFAYFLTITCNLSSGFFSTGFHFLHPLPITKYSSSNFGLKSRYRREIDAFESDSDDLLNYNLRFGGIGRLYSNDSGINGIEKVLEMQRLAEATVAVIGVGGVGSWTAEALCRSGIGNIILFDLDDVCISNSNRQLHTTSSSIGELKVDVMRKRILDINPQCNVTTIVDFVSSDGAHDAVQSMLPELTCIVDAIDGKKEKTAIIAACAALQVPIVTVGGAAGRVDPTKIICDDLIKVQEDRLLFWCRKDLRQKYGFPKGPTKYNKKIYKPRRWRIWAVYSLEVQKSLSAKEKENTSSLRTCDSSLGTACFVTGTYGFVAAAKVVSMIAKDELTRPRYRGSLIRDKHSQEA